MTEAPKQPERILIFDTTLRDGAQSPGISLSTEQSLNIARQLNRLGVDVIEAGFPVSSPGNFEAVQTIARAVEGPVIAGLARAEGEDVKSAYEAVRDSERPRIHTFISTSDIHIQHQLESTREEVKGMARAAVAHARSLVDDVQFSPMDATRADLDFTAEVVDIAIEEGATTINIPDTVGYTTPTEYAKFLGTLYELVPALGGVVLSVHCHDDLGLAVANSFAGVQAGARQVEAAINGLGERAGNASLEEMVMLLRTRRDVDGYDTGIDSEQIGPTSRMVSRYTGYMVPGNKAIVGRNAFSHESGIHQDGVLKERTTFEIMSAESVGVNTKSIVLGKQSGNAAMIDALQQEGVYKPDYRKFTFKLFKQLADRVGDISREQIVEIHEEAQRRHTNPYDFDDDYQITASGKDFSARVKVWRGGEVTPVTAKNGIEHPGIDGSISALFSALNEATDTDYALDEYTTGSVGQSKETIGKASVSLKVGDQIVTGHGIALDSNKAAAWAYLDAIRKANEVQAS
jgi:2-isopropylmalate synthase